MVRPLKPLYWVGTAYRDLLAMPADVIDTFGFALHLAQGGGKHAQAKPLKGFGSASVLEVVEDYRGDTFRAVYTVKVANGIYVLHCFQKKSTRGIATSRQDLDLVADRLKRVLSHIEGASND